MDQSKLNESNSIDVRLLPNGIYTLILQAKEGVEVLKFVKRAGME